MKISLIGAMASGKTTIGILLAKKLKFRLHDTDSVIETKLGMSVSDIFATHGEQKFRALETETLKDLFTHPDNMIIATGGGIIKNLENRKLLKENSKVFFLDISVAEQLKRTEGDTTRPLLMVSNREEKLKFLRAERISFYQETAHHIIAVDGFTPEEITKDILFALKIS